MCEFTEAANRKGYSALYICELMNRDYGWKIHINSFRNAVTKRQTEFQQDVYRTAQEILDNLPVRECPRSDLSERARRAQISMKDVWRYYTTTRKQNRSYEYFLQATRRRMTPSEAELFAEAERIIENEADKVRELKA